MPFGLKPKCNMCKTTTSSMWRKDDDGEIICNSCSVRSTTINNNKNNGNGCPFTLRKSTRAKSSKFKQQILSKSSNPKGKSRRSIFKKTCAKARSSFSTRSEEKTPCSFYKVTKDEDGKLVFSKALLKYFFTVDSPEMDDLKNKRWNTSFLHETPKPNREIKIFTDEENNDPKYFENMPNIESNLPDIPGTLHKDVFKNMPINESDEELKELFKELTPVKGPNGKKKRKSRRITCFNRRHLTEDSLFYYTGLDSLFDSTGLQKSGVSSEDVSVDSKENIMKIKVEEDQLT